MRLGKSQREKTREVASVACYRDGKILWLKRADVGLWTMPGGHLEPHEKPLDGAKRELLEETGLKGKNFKYLGSGEVPSTDLTIHSYTCECNTGEPSAEEDPDAEAEEFQWFAPEDIPKDNQLHVPRNRNITLQLLGLAETELSKSRKEWRSKDGLRIPHHTDPSRGAWDRAYKQKLVEVFANGDSTRLKKVKVPVSEHHYGHLPAGAVGAGGRDRRGFYARMVAGGDRLPPPVVRRNGLGWTFVDGNARLHAALKRGLTHIDALELVDPVRKAESNLQAAFLGPDGRIVITGSIHDISQLDGDYNTWEPGFVDDQGNFLTRDSAQSLKKAPFDDASWSIPDATRYLADPPRGFKATEYLGSTQLRPGYWLHEYKAPFGDGTHRTYHLSTSKDPVHKNLKPVQGHVGGRVDKDGFKIDTTIIHPAHQKQGLATDIYKYLALKHGGKVYSGGSQSPEARKLWESLGKQPSVQVTSGKRGDYDPDVLTLKSERDDIIQAATNSLDDSLRKPKYRGHPNPLHGSCYCASEAVFHMLGGHNSGWVPQNVRHEGDQHWYLKHKHTGEILDPTAGQFHTPVPYEKGRGRGFLTHDPSKRAAELISRVRAKLALNKSEPDPQKLVSALKDVLAEDQTEETPAPISTPADHPDANFEDEDGWTQAKYRRGGEREFANYVPPTPAEEAEYWSHAPIAKGEDWQSMEGPEEPEDLPDTETPTKPTKKGTKELRGPIPLTTAFRAYKNSPHNPVSLFLKYAIHRAENEDFYNAAKPEAIKSRETAWLDHHQQGGAKYKNGDVKLDDLHETLKQNPDFIGKLRTHQKKLHKYILQMSPHRVHMINGEPHVALARGYSVKDPGADHELASYTDNPALAKVFGEHVKTWMVPFKNLWYSFMTGPAAASSVDHGPEDEYLVNNHARHPAEQNDVGLLVPRDAHNFKTPSQAIWRLQSGQRLYDTLSSSQSALSQFLLDPENAGYAAVHPDLHPDTISDFLARPDDGHFRQTNTQQTLLRRKDITPEMLKRTINSRAAESSRAVAAAHPHANPEVWEAALADPSETVQRGILDNLDLPSEYVDRLTHHPDYDTTIDALSHPNAPPHRLAEALKSDNAKFQRAAAENPNTRATDLEEAYGPTDTDDFTNKRQLRILRNKNLTPEFLDRVVSNPTPISDPTNYGDPRAILAIEHPNTTPELLEKWSHIPGSRVQESVAKNTKTPVATLVRLMSSPFTNARVEAFSNKSLTPDALIANINTPGLAFNSTDNPHWTPETLEEASKVANTNALPHLLNHRLMPQFVLEQMATHSDPHMRMAAVSSGRLSKDAMEKIFNTDTYGPARARAVYFLERIPTNSAKKYADYLQTKHNWRTTPEGLVKSISGALLGSLLATAPIHSTNKPGVTTKEIGQATNIPWSPVGLHQDLIPIAHLESNFGRNTAHRPNSKGSYHTAVGALGIKPVTAHEEYNRNPILRATFGEIPDPTTFTNRLNSDPAFYNTVTSAHFLRLKKLHGSTERAVYAYRHGSGAVKNATPHQVNVDPYVMTYRAHTLRSGVKKSEEDTSFDFGANVPTPSTEPSQAELCQLKINRMHPVNRKMAQDWHNFCLGKTNIRPHVTPLMERHLARYGIVDPAGYTYSETGRDMARATPGRKGGGEEPAELKRLRLLNQPGGQDLPYQR